MITIVPEDSSLGETGSDQVGVDVCLPRHDLMLMIRVSVVVWFGGDQTAF